MSKRNPVKCKCPICGKEYLTFRAYNPPRTCSKKCACEKRRRNYIEKYGKPYHNNSNNREKAKQTCLERYGVENPSQIEDIKNKKEETCLKHYGKKYYTQTDEAKEKIKKKCMEKYSVECNFQAKEIIEKIKKTNLERYGSESHNSSEIVKQHKKEAYFKKYGYEYNFQNPIVKEKIKQTSLERYGVENPGDSLLARKKSKITKLQRYGDENYTNIEKRKKTLVLNKSYNTSILENFIYKLLTKLNLKIIRQYSSDKYPWLCDFYIPEKDLYIEIQGFAGHGKLGTKVFGPYDYNNPEHQALLKIWQDKAKNNSWYASAIRIWTIEDPKKRKMAKDNNLNWLEFFTLEDFIEWYINFIETEK